MDTANPWVYVFLGLYLAVMAVLCMYGMHRYHLVHLYYKYRRNRPELRACFRELPRVTIQLPMYNEQYVAQRIIEAACRIEYPRDRLQIQVLDDSTDETTAIAQAAVHRMCEAGHPVVYLHRDHRTGYKAGALAAGLESATGEFVMIFDADFLPPPEILHETIHYFTDPRVGMVQSRWDHINREHSLLTKTQAILLDGHFMIEHTARNRSGRFMSFNGTAGMWRRSCIDEAGGWQHDTLTEDLDLSYRAQMKGWRFIFLPELLSPAELPPEMNGFKSQQYRWAKGGAQTCRKLLPKVLCSRLPWKVKLEAFFHLTSCTVYVYIVLLTLMLYPVVYLKLHFFEEGLARYLFDASLLLLATCSASTFYAASQREVSRTWAESLKYLPFLMSLGIGISLNNAKAALAGLFGRPSEFERTPKYGVDANADTRWRGRVDTYRPRRKIKLLPFVELAFGLYLFLCMLLCFSGGKVSIGIVFVALFMAGYLYVALMTWFGHRVHSPLPVETLATGLSMPRPAEALKPLIVEAPIHLHQSPSDPAGSASRASKSSAGM
ncbi:MAG: glycosyltransferase [Phycisphaerae bacterium]|nr:glycosyltransferase [Phycisphaerae bacterium]